MENETAKKEIALHIKIFFIPLYFASSLTLNKR